VLKRRLLCWLAGVGGTIYLAGLLRCNTLGRYLRKAFTIIMSQHSGCTLLNAGIASHNLTPHQSATKKHALGQPSRATQLRS
jgi:hypothetical protein